MGRDLDLKRRLEWAGLEVIEIAGWQTRGGETFNPKGSVNHHTAGPRRGFAPSLGICINGRSDLPGPLCNVHGPREESLRVHLVAAGRANHAGRGGWLGITGNSSVFGLEEEHCGYPDEPISELRLDRMARVHAAFAIGRFDARMTCQHHEWTSRKVDFVRGLVDPDDFRRRVHERIALMFHPEQENDLTPEQDARLKAVESGLASVIRRLDTIVDRVLPAETQKESIRNVRRIGFHVGAKGIEGDVPEYPGA